MSNNFAFNAPTYFDFNSASETDKDLEMYFEADHEHVILQEVYSCNTLALDHESLCGTKVVENGRECASPDSGSESERGQLRKSRSLDNFTQIEKNTSENDKLPASLNLKAKTYRTKNISTERLNELSKPKPFRSGYLSTAEQLTKFYENLHTTSRKRGNVEVQSAVPLSQDVAIKNCHRDKPTQTIEDMKLLHIKPRMRTTNIFKKPVIVVSQPSHLARSKPMKAGVAVDVVPRAGPCKPFSFDVRDKEIAQRRQEKMSKALENEKTRRSFKAAPMPNFQLPMGAFKKFLSVDNLKVSENEDKTTTKSERLSAENLEVGLNTQRRAKAREEFQKRSKERHDRITAEKMHLEEAKKLREKDQKAKLRKVAVHVAQPVRRYKKVQVEPSNQITLPVTPKLGTGKRQQNSD